MILIYKIKRDVGTLEFNVDADVLMDDKICNIINRIISKLPKECDVFKEDIRELLLYKRLEIKFVSS